MCKKGTPKKLVPIDDGEYHDEFYVDRCIANIVEKLNQVRGLRTLGSCCGHGIYPMTIIVKDHSGVRELVSGKHIPRKRRFYKKDKKGNFYIPEVIE